LYARGEKRSTIPHQTSTAIPWTPANLSAFRDTVKALILGKKKKKEYIKYFYVSNEILKKTLI
jgi:hypothetical protein